MDDNRKDFISIMFLDFQAVQTPTHAKFVLLPFFLHEATAKQSMIAICNCTSLLFPAF